MFVPDLERLANPPIVEVACGIGFEPVPDVDPMLVGGYWTQPAVRDRFPLREVHPAIEERLAGEPGILVTEGAPPLRAWLLSRDGAFLVQIQADRFFLNWRWVGAEYPAFNGTGGVLERTLREFDQISAYVLEVTGRSLQAVRVDVVKVDMLVEARHWTDLQDMALMAPSLAAHLRFGPFSNPAFSFRMAEEVAGAQVRLAADLHGVLGARHVRLETHVTATLERGERIADGLVRIEKLADDVFGALISREQRQRRFGAVA